MSAAASAPRMSEKAWQGTVTDLAERLGWSWMHAERIVSARKNRDGSTRFVNETPLRGPLGAGFPDLVMVRDRLIFVELKGPRGRVSVAQTLVLAQLREAGAETYVWAPDDWTEIQRVLARPHARSGPAAEKRPGPGNAHPEQGGIA